MRLLCGCLEQCRVWSVEPDTATSQRDHTDHDNPIPIDSIQYIARIKCWGNRSSHSHLLPSVLSLAELLPAPVDPFLALNHIME